MRIFRNKTFSRYARKEGITDNELRAVIPQLEENNPDANLGGEVFKLRVARPGDGKSGGYRVLVYYRSGERTFFAHGFAKSNLANIGEKDLRDLKAAASDMLSMSEARLETMLKSGKLIEISEAKHEEVSK
jgi:hypothetical protein